MRLMLSQDSWDGDEEASDEMRALIRGHCAVVKVEIEVCGVLGFAVAGKLDPDFLKCWIW